MTSCLPVYVPLHVFKRILCSAPVKLVKKFTFISPGLPHFRKAIHLVVSFSFHYHKTIIGTLGRAMDSFNWI